MAGDASAFAVLGLEPGASAEVVEQAYRRLIKQHHPDRPGGDSERAAEIIRAYRELRAAQGYKDPLEFNDQSGSGLRGRRGWGRPAAIALGVVVLAWLAVGPILLDRDAWPVALHLPTHHAAIPADPMDEPLHYTQIDRAIRQAEHISRSQDEMALASASRDCNRKFRTDPDIKTLDRCAAFDDAVVELQDRDPLRDTGPFSQIAVTGRQWSAASSLSDDYLAVDGRLDRIRLHVQLALAPSEPPPIEQQIKND